MTKYYSLKGIVDGMIGPVEPCGSHGEDQERLENLKNLCELSEEITQKLCQVASVEHRDRSSMRMIVNYARKHLESEVEDISGAININES